MDELYQSNFEGKPEINSNLIPVKCRFSKVWGKALTLPPAVLSTWRVKQNLLFSAKGQQESTTETTYRVKNTMTNKNIWPFWFYLTYILQVWGANLQVFGSFFSNTSDLHGLGVGRSEEAISNFTDSCYKYLKMSSFFWEIKTNSTGLKLNRELGQFPLLISVSNLHC